MELFRKFIRFGSVTRPLNILYLPRKQVQYFLFPYRALIGARIFEGLGGGVTFPGKHTFHSHKVWESWALSVIVLFTWLKRKYIFILFSALNVVVSAWAPPQERFRLIWPLFHCSYTLKMRRFNLYSGLSRTFLTLYLTIVTFQSFYWTLFFLTYLSSISFDLYFTIVTLSQWEGSIFILLDSLPYYKTGLDSLSQ